MTHLVVIGHTGQVSRELRLVQMPPQWRMTSLDRSRIDLADPVNFRAIIEPLKPDVIINAAGYTAVDKAEEEQDLAMQVNGQAPGQLGRIAAELDIPFLHVSTDYVFDGTATLPYTELDQPAPLNVYGRSKLAGETAVLETGARAIVLRTSWVFSPFGQNFVKTMLRLGASRDHLSIVCDQRGGPTPAHDIAVTLLTLARHLVNAQQTHTGIFHYSGHPSTSWADFAGAIFAGADWLTRKPEISFITTSDYPTPAPRPLFSLLDCSKLHRHYGIEQPDWRQGLARTLNYLKLELTGNQTP